MARDRSRDAFELRMLGVSAAFGACFGAAYGVWLEPCAGLAAGAVIGAVVGLIMTPALVIAAGESGHPMALPGVFVVTLLASFAAGSLRLESPAVLLGPCAVCVVACAAAGRVFPRDGGGVAGPPPGPSD